MDVVERVHQKVGVNLIFQILQLLLKVLFLEKGKLLLVSALPEIEFHAEVHAKHEDEDDEGDDVVLP